MSGDNFIIFVSPPCKRKMNSKNYKQIFPWYLDTNKAFLFFTIYFLLNCGPTSIILNTHKNKLFIKIMYLVFFYYNVTWIAFFPPNIRVFSNQFTMSIETKYILHIDIMHFKKNNKLWWRMISRFESIKKNGAKILSHKQLFKIL